MTATRARYRVVALATTLAMVTYLDRVAIGTLAPGIRRDLGLTAVQMGWVFTVFQLAYGLFEVPTGRWADRVGTRSVLARIVIWWSALTAATAAAFNYPVMLAGAVPVRRRRGGRVALCGADVLALDSAQRARTRAGHLLRRRAPGRRPDAGRHRRRRPAGQLARHAQRDVVARRVRRLRPGRIGVGRGVAVLVPKRPVGTSGSERRGARRDRGGPAARVSAPERPGLLARADSQPEHDRAERHVHPELHDFLFLHHLAADLSAGAARVQYLRDGALCRSAAAGQHARRSARRVADRPPLQPLRPSRRPLRVGSRRLPASSASA